jgi:methionyl-tRNA synthetase
LINYISCLGWPEDEKKFKDFWPGLQVAGKDNLRQQTAMWQAMLMSAGLPNSTQVLIFGFITAQGKKMSKSLGNVVDPFALADKYGTDAVRYYLLADLTPYEDSDYTEEKFHDRYTADLANGLGNLVSRTANLLGKNRIGLELKLKRNMELTALVGKEMAGFHFDNALKALWASLRVQDEILSATTPWKMKDQAEIKKILEPIAQNILDIAYLLLPFMPATAEKIIKQFSAKQIEKSDPLFPRLV